MTTTAVYRGCTLGDVLDAVADARLCGPWVTLAELERFGELLEALTPRADTPPADWLAWAADEGVDPITGKASLRRVG